MTLLGHYGAPTSCMASDSVVATTSHGGATLLSNWFHNSTVQPLSFPPQFRQQVCARFPYCPPFLPFHDDRRASCYRWEKQCRPRDTVTTHWQSDVGSIADATASLVTKAAELMQDPQLTRYYSLYSGMRYRRQSQRRGLALVSRACRRCAGRSGLRTPPGP